MDNGYQGAARSFTQRPTPPLAALRRHPAPARLPVASFPPFLCAFTRSWRSSYPGERGKRVPDTRGPCLCIDCRQGSVLGQIGRPTGTELRIDRCQVVPLAVEDRWNFHRIHGGGSMVGWRLHAFLKMRNVGHLPSRKLDAGSHVLFRDSGLK